MKKKRNLLFHNSVSVRLLPVCFFSILWLPIYFFSLFLRNTQYRESDYCPFYLLDWHLIQIGRDLISPALFYICKGGIHLFSYNIWL